MTDADHPTDSLDSLFGDTPATKPLPEDASAAATAGPASAAGPDTAAGPATAAWRTPGAAAWRTPRVRWAGVVWGALFAAFGIVTMIVVSTEANRQAYAAWADGLGPWGAGIVALVAVGALLLITGVLGAVRHAQRSRP
jgi:hypothetical protein